MVELVVCFWDCCVVVEGHAGVVEVGGRLVEGGFIAGVGRSLVVIVMVPGNTQNTIITKILMEAQL
jgi:hypothetical protein